MAESLDVVRRFLLVILMIGMIGLGAELLLLGHVDGILQWIPVALLAAGSAAGAWHAAMPRTATVRTLQAVMALFVISGLAGIGLHYDGNAEFELEMYPSLSGLALFKQTMTGATPVLAPGTMALLGLVGLAHTYRHPKASGLRAQASGGPRVKASEKQETGS